MIKSRGDKKSSMIKYPVIKSKVINSPVTIINVKYCRIECILDCWIAG